MKCEKCKKETETVYELSLKAERVALCRECYAEVYKLVRGKEYAEVMDR